MKSGLVGHIPMCILQEMLQWSSPIFGENSFPIFCPFIVVRVLEIVNIRSLTHDINVLFHGIGNIASLHMQG